MTICCNSVRLKTLGLTQQTFPLSTDPKIFHAFSVLFSYIIWETSQFKEWHAGCCLPLNIGTLYYSVCKADKDYFSSWSFMKFILSYKSSGHQNQSVGHILILGNIMYIWISIYILCLWKSLCVQKQTRCQCLSRQDNFQWGSDNRNPCN